MRTPGTEIEITFTTEFDPRSVAPDVPVDLGGKFMDLKVRDRAKPEECATLVRIALPLIARMGEANGKALMAGLVHMVTKTMRSFVEEEGSTVLHEYIDSGSADWLHGMGAACPLCGAIYGDGPERAP